jgi:hypothetical protein
LGWSISPAGPLSWNRFFQEYRVCLEMPTSGAKSPAGRPLRCQQSRMSSRCSGVIAGSGVAGGFSARRDRDRPDPASGPRPDSGGMKGRSISGVGSNASGCGEGTFDSSGCAPPRLRRGSASPDESRDSGPAVAGGPAAGMMILSGLGICRSSNTTTSHVAAFAAVGRRELPRPFQLKKRTELSEGRQDLIVRKVLLNLRFSSAVASQTVPLLS